MKFICIKKTCCSLNIINVTFVSKFSDQKEIKKINIIQQMISKRTSARLKFILKNNWKLR